MDLNLTQDEQKFRDSLRTWLQANLPERRVAPVTDAKAKSAHFEYLRAWQQRLFEGGWAGISWPKEHGGRGATLVEQAIFQEGLALADAPERPAVLGEALVGPTIIAVGTEAQRRRYLAPILSGQEIWCQGFSEPNSGSDLASLGTKAIREGDDFLVSGRKIWTGFAHIADWCLL